MTDEMELEYLKVLESLQSNLNLSEFERQALKAILAEYDSYKVAYARSMEEQDELADMYYGKEAEIEQLRAELDH